MNPINILRGLGGAKAPVGAHGGAYNTLLTQISGAKYADWVRRGIVWGGMTDATGITPADSIGTTPPFALENPEGTGIVAVLLKFSVGYVSGTLAPGIISHALSDHEAAATPIVTATDVVPVNLRSRWGRGNTRPKAKLYDAPTLLAAPSPVRSAFNLDSSLAAGTSNAFVKAIEELDGEFQLDPGGVWSVFHDAVGGTSDILRYGLVWGEVPESEWNAQE